MATEVCVDCGRPEDQAPGVVCAQPEWHDTTEAPVPQPALAGDDLVRHLQRRVAYAEDQVQLATRLLVAILQGLPEQQVRVTDARLVEAEERQLETWYDTASGETLYRVVSR